MSTPTPPPLRFPAMEAGHGLASRTSDGAWRLDGRIVDPNVASLELMRQAATHRKNLAIEWTRQSIARARNIKL